MLIKKVETLINKFLEFNDFKFIYNEISLQLELGIFLRQQLKNFKVEFERNISMFVGNEQDKCIKHEIDIVIYDDDLKEKCAIELKYPRNKAYGKRMGLFLKDITFIEELKDKYGFAGGFVLAVVDTIEEKGFYEGKYNENKIQAIFRSKGNVLYNNKYSIKWKDKNEKLKYYLLTI